MSVLSINAGSSSIRFSFHGAGSPPIRLLDGKVERIGQRGTNLSMAATRIGEVPQLRLAMDAADWHSAARFLLEWLEAHPLFEDVQAVGHRVVHGMSHTSPERVTEALLAELRSITPYDPEHLPREIELMETVGRRFPRLPQVACFDTAFHRSMPRVATILPIPRRYRVARRAALRVSRAVVYVPYAGARAPGRPGSLVAAASSSRTSAAVRASRPCATANASIPAWGLRRRREC